MEAEFLSKIGLAKKALHTSLPEDLPCRDVQIETINNFLLDHLNQENSGSLYISGSPGTGKTAVLHYVLQKLRSKDVEKQSSFKTVFINCMSISSTSVLLQQISSDLSILKSGSMDEIWNRLKIRFLRESGKMILLVLDELDQVLTGRGNMSYMTQLFELTQNGSSKLILVGVANSLDLITRHLPHLTTSASPPRIVKTNKAKAITKDDTMESFVQLLHFRPYDREEIIHILEKRLASVGLGKIFDELALKLVAGRIGSSTGDMRKALNACKTALENFEKDGRRVLTETADDGFNCSTPKRRCIVPDGLGIGSVAKVLSIEKEGGNYFPLQQLILIGTLVRLHGQRKENGTEDGVSSPIPIPIIYNAYQEMATKEGYELIEQSDMISMFAMLEDRSLVSVSRIGSRGSLTSSPSSPRIYGSPRALTKKGILSSNKTVDGVTFNPSTLQYILRQGNQPNIS